MLTREGLEDGRFPEKFPDAAWEEVKAYSVKMLKAAFTEGKLPGM